MGRISARTAGIAESATLAVEAKAKAMRSAGQDVIGFGAGEPDFPTPEHIIAAAVEACRQPRFHHYTPTAGLPALREAIARATALGSGRTIETAQVLVTNGAKQAIFNALAALLDPGDEVLLTSPYWVTYPEAVRLCGGVPVEVPTEESRGFRASVEDLERVRGPRTKALIFVSPSNPTGAVYPPEEIEAIGRWAAGHGLWVLTDEIYEHLVYDDARHVSMPAVVPELQDRCVVFSGVSKTYAMTGWRLGWLVGPRDLVGAATNLQSHTTSNVGNIAQAAALAALEGGLESAHAMREAFDRRRRLMVKLLEEIPGVSCFEPKGAFYAYPSFAGVLGRTIGGRRVDTSLELAEVLLEEALVAIVPGEAFGTPGYARLSYALDDDALAEGIGRIASLLS